MSFVIELDDQDVEVGRKEKTRGRPPKGFHRHSDGNWYNRVPLQTEQAEVIPSVEVKESNEDAEAETPEQSEIRPGRPRKRIVAVKRTTLTVLLNAFSPLHTFVDGEKIHLTSPIKISSTGLAILDSFSGQPIFHEVIIDMERQAVTVFGVKDMINPMFLIEEALFSGDYDGIKTQIKRHNGR